MQAPSGTIGSVSLIISELIIIRLIFPVHLINLSWINLRLGKSNSHEINNKRKSTKQIILIISTFIKNIYGSLAISPA